MKYILTSFSIFLLSITGVKAQEDFLLDRTWEISQYQIIFLGEETNLYHKDSTDNILDLSNIEFLFSTDGSYSVKVMDKESQGQWALTEQRDSIIIDGETFDLYNLSEESFIFRSYKLEYADTSARLDTVYFYNKLKPVPGSEKVTGIKKDKHENALSVYPNPSDNLVTVRLISEALKEENAYYRILNLNGKELDKQAIPGGRSTFDIPIGTLPKGVYILEILSKRSRRLAIQKLLKE